MVCPPGWLWGSSTWRTCRRSRRRWRPGCTSCGRRRIWSRRRRWRRTGRGWRTWASSPSRRLELAELWPCKGTSKYSGDVFVAKINYAWFSGLSLQDLGASTTEWSPIWSSSSHLSILLFRCKSLPSFIISTTMKKCCNDIMETVPQGGPLTWLMALLVLALAWLALHQLVNVSKIKEKKMQ